MNSRATAKFWAAFKTLPTNIQQLARAAYKAFQQNPYDPTLHFKLVKGTTDQYSVRIGHSYRALGKMASSDTIVWYWIGSHSDYMKLIP